MITDHRASTKLTNGKGLSARMIMLALKLAVININFRRRAGTENVVAGDFPRYPQSMQKSAVVQCCALQAMGFICRKQKIACRRNDPLPDKFIIICRTLTR